MARGGGDPLWIRDHPERDPRIEATWLAALGRSWRETGEAWLIAQLLEYLPLLDVTRVQAAIGAIRAVDGTKHGDARTLARWRADGDARRRLRVACARFSLEARSDPDPLVRTVTLHGLSSRPREAAGQHPAILDGLRDAVPGVRLAAAGALRAAWRGRKQGRSTMLAAQRLGAAEVHPEVRWAIYRATRSAGWSHREWMKLWDTLSSSRRWADRYAAPAGVLRSTPLTVPFLAPLLDSGDRSLRVVAAMALAVRSEHPEARAALQHALTDPSREVRRRARFGFDRLKG